MTNQPETTTTYVTVMDAKPRSGWLVAHRDGDCIVHTRLTAKKLEIDGGGIEAARAEAQAMFPDAHVYCAGDEVKPWKQAA
jgi:hypothetical protein